MSALESRKRLIAEHFLRPGVPWLFIGGPWHGSSFRIRKDLQEVRALTDTGELVSYRGELRGSEAHPYRLAMHNPTPEQLQDYRRMTELKMPADDC